jgi:hypothetical protein
VNEVHKEEAALVWLACDTCGKLYPDKSVLNSHAYMAHYYKNRSQEARDTVSDLRIESVTSMVEDGPITAQPAVDSGGGAAGGGAAGSNMQQCDSTTVDQEMGPATCHLCRAEFGRKHDLFHHANLQHRDEVSKRWKLCRTCLWFFPSKKSLTRDRFCETAFRPKKFPTSFFPQN